MKEILIFLLTFLNFWFFPFVIALVVAFFVEQVVKRSSGFQEKDIETAVRIRRFLWRQNIILNFSWFLCYFILMFAVRTPQTQMPDMIWRG
tara:strand:+ start:1218 stop:1490 length:273 start_codon:yes stop_codon:yes gene_type:complete